MKPTVKEFFDKATWTLTFVVSDTASKDAVIIDPVWDYDPAGSRLSTKSADQVLDYVRANDLKVHYILETHAHADHISSSQYLKQKLGAKVAIGSNITKVQSVFAGVFNLPSTFKTDGSQFDLLLQEDRPLHAGSLKIDVLFTPGHTPACSTFVIGDAVFTGDTIFMPDQGTGRCDFPAGSPEDLYNSITNKLYKLPDHYRMFVGHDYQPGGRSVQFETTIGEQKQKNIHVKAQTSKAEFVEYRTTRDKTLEAPRLLLQSVQVNIAAGALPAPEANGGRYLKIPVRE